MTAKRATSAKEREERPPLTKAEACRVLQVAPTADEQLIAKAYWYLARKYRTDAPRDAEARERLDEINRAYIVLNPTEREAPLSREVEIPSEHTPPGFFQQLFTSWRKMVDHTRAVWPEHVGEVGVLTATTAVLTYLALSSGASALWTLVAAGIAGLAIWAPWRRAS